MAENPFAAKYRAKNEARHKALNAKKDSESAERAMKDIPVYLKRKKTK